MTTDEVTLALIIDLVKEYYMLYGDFPSAGQLKQFMRPNS